jgi:hypothetical protein
MSRRRFSIPVGLAGLVSLSCELGEEDDEIAYGCVFVDAGSSCPTDRPTWVDVHSENDFLFGGDGSYQYYGYYEYGYSEEPESEDPECGTSVGQYWGPGDYYYGYYRDYCRSTGIEYVGRERPESATSGCAIPADTDLCCYQFSCELPAWRQ